MYPLKPDPKTNNNSSKKIIQRFNYQFRALGRLIDKNDMVQASVDQAEAMMKALETMRTNLDKFDDIDLKEIVIDRNTYNINDTLQA